jgi:DNA-binding MarR family transcriptional regulator
MTDRCSRTTARIGRVTDLTEHDIDEISKQYREGRTQRSIAKERGFTQSYISMLIHKQRGKNLS